MLAHGLQQCTAADIGKGDVKGIGQAIGRMTIENESRDGGLKPRLQRVPRRTQPRINGRQTTARQARCSA